jgi:hypothetical protein
MQMAVALFVADDVQLRHNWQRLWCNSLHHNALAALEA